MNFIEIAKLRQSCRSYDETKPVEKEKLDSMLNAVQLAPSACNGQPYHFTVCTDETAKKIAKATARMGLNKFASQAPVMIVVSEESYTKMAAAGSVMFKNDYRSMDIGIAVAYLTAEAAVQGLGTCILGCFDESEVKKICGIKHPVRLIITVGYAKEDDPLRNKKRKTIEELVSYK